MTSDIGNPLQPQVRPEEVLADLGRWTIAGAARVRNLMLEGHELIWKPGKFAHVATMGGRVVGNIHRHRPEHPWIMRIEGFEWWHAPTRIITRWHYTPTSGIRDLRAAKKLFSTVVSNTPTVVLPHLRCRR